MANSNISGNSMRGSGDILAFPDSVFLLLKKGLRSNEYSLQQVKNRDRELISDINFRVVDTGQDTSQHGIHLVNTDLEIGQQKIGDPSKNLTEAIKKWIRDEKLSDFKTKQVLDQFKSFNRTSLTKLLNDLANDGCLIKLGKGHWGLKNGENGIAV